MTNYCPGSVLNFTTETRLFTVQFFSSDGGRWSLPVVGWAILAFPPFTDEGDDSIDTTLHAVVLDLGYGRVVPVREYVINYNLTAPNGIVDWAIHSDLGSA